MELIVGLLMAAVAIFLYFVPAVAARNKRHKNQQAILVLNLFLGWTFLGWVVALVWACKKSDHAEPEYTPIPEDSLASLAKDCPFCAEKVLKNARVCKHCGSDLLGPAGAA